MSVTVRSAVHRRFGKLVLRLAAAALSTVVALAAGEAIVRLVLPQQLTGCWFTADPATGLELHRTNWNAVHRYGDRCAQYTFDQHGLRVDAKSRPAGGASILCLGDSLLFGLLLNDEETCLHHLQGRLDAQLGPRRIRLVNGAHGGWGASDYVRYVDEYAAALRPAAIVVFMSAHDIDRSFEHPRYELTEGHAAVSRKRSPPAPGMTAAIRRTFGAIPGYRWLLEHSHLVHLARRVVLLPSQSAPYVPPAAKPGEVVRLGRALFCRLRDWAQAHSCRLLVLTTGFLQCPPAVARGPRTQEFLKARPAVLEHDGIEFHNCSAALHEKIGGDYTKICIPGDGHPNPAGARLMAELNWPYLYPLAARILSDGAQAAGSQPSPQRVRP